MSEMVERVARATYEARPYGDEHAGDLIWDRLEDGWKDRHRDMARAAIEAMREPTDAMVDAAYGRERTGTERGNWRAMIDAALTETQPSSPEIAVQRQPEKQDG